MNRISGRTSLSCPRTSGNSSTNPRLEQNERTTLEPKALRGKLYRETCGTLSNDSTELSDRANDRVSDPATQASASQHLSLSALDMCSQVPRFHWRVWPVVIAPIGIAHWRHDQFARFDVIDSGDVDSDANPRACAA